MSENTVAMSDISSEELSQSVVDEETPPQLTFNDIRAARNVMNLAQTRGAIQPNETASFGAVWNTLTSWINYTESRLDAQKSSSVDV